MEIKELAGFSVLSAVDRLSGTHKRYEDDEYPEPCEILRVVLGGRAIEVRENPGDGYRSNHIGPRRTRAKIKNRFADVPVFCLHQTSGQSYGDDDILVVYASATGKELLRFGTSNVDDYYPSWVCNFDAEALDAAIGDPRARLIAAAPDLLEALEWLVANVEGSELGSPPLMVKARAAIAKARGQEAQ